MASQCTVVEEVIQAGWEHLILGYVGVLQWLETENVTCTLYQGGGSTRSFCRHLWGRQLQKLSGCRRAEAGATSILRAVL